MGIELYYYDKCDTTYYPIYEADKSDLYYELHNLGWTHSTEINTLNEVKKAILVYANKVRTDTSDSRIEQANEFYDIMKLLGLV